MRGSRSRSSTGASPLGGRGRAVDWRLQFHSFALWRCRVGPLKRIYRVSPRSETTCVAVTRLRETRYIAQAAYSLPRVCAPALDHASLGQDGQLCPRQPQLTAQDLLVVLPYQGRSPRDLPGRAVEYAGRPGMPERPANLRLLNLRPEPAVLQVGVFHHLVRRTHGAQVESALLPAVVDLVAGRARKQHHKQLVVGDNIGVPFLLVDEVDRQSQLIIPPTQHLQLLSGQPGYYLSAHVDVLAVSAHVL